MNDATLAQMVAALQAENQQLRDWRDSATMSCAKRKCATRERDLREAENERDEANKVCEQWRQWTVATRAENDSLRAEVASWKRLADIQEGSLKESCAEVERLKAVMDDPLNSGEWHNPDDLVRIRELEAAGRAVLACTDKVCGLPGKCFKHCEADAMLRAVLPTGTRHE